MTTTAPSPDLAVAPLIGRKVGNCWEAMRLVLAAVLGVEAPATATEALVGARPVWSRVDPLAPRAGDVLVFRMSDGRDHVGVALDYFRFAHGDEKVAIRIDRTAAWVPRLKFAARWTGGDAA